MGQGEAVFAKAVPKADLECSPRSTGQAAIASSGKELPPRDDKFLDFEKAIYSLDNSVINYLNIK